MPLLQYVNLSYERAKEYSQTAEKAVMLKKRCKFIAYIRGKVLTNRPWHLAVRTSPRFLLSTLLL